MTLWRKRSLTLNHGNKGSTDKLLGGLGNGSTTIEDDSQSPSSLLSDLIEDDGIGQSRDERQMVVLRRDLGVESKVEHLLLESTGSFNFTKDTFTDELPDGWDTDKDTLLVSSDPWSYAQH